MPNDRDGSTVISSKREVACDVARLVEVYRRVDVAITPEDAKALWLDVSKQHDMWWTPMPEDDRALLACCARLLTLCVDGDETIH